MRFFFIDTKFMLKREVIKIENIETFLLGLASIIVAIGVLIKAIKSTKKEIDSLPKKIKKQANIDDLIISKMEEVKEQLNADRVQIYDFHNGGHYANGRSALKVSCSYEVCRTGIQPKQSQLQSIPISCISKFTNKILNDEKFEVKDLEEIKEEMPATYQLKKDMNLNSFYDVALKNSKNETIGFLAVQFVKNPYNVKTEKDKEAILKLKFLIEEKFEFLIDKK